MKMKLAFDGHEKRCTCDILMNVGKSKFNTLLPDHHHHHHSHDRQCRIIGSHSTNLYSNFRNLNALCEFSFDKRNFVLNFKRNIADT